LRSCVLLFLLFLVGTASAEEARPLGKSAVEALASGKQWLIASDAHGPVSEWTFKGQFMFTNHTSMARGTALDNRVHMERGTWAVNDDGVLCVVFRGGFPDQCVVVVRVGEVLKVAAPDNLAAPIGTLTVKD
jgi:hypothetical protein